MKITTNLKQEISEIFNNDWSNYCENNDIDENDDEAKDIFKEEWLSEHEDFLDAIIEEVDSLDFVEYITDPLDYEIYQQAEQILNNFIYNEL